MTEFKSHKTITGTLTLPATVVKLTVPDTATVAGVTSLGGGGGYRYNHFITWLVERRELANTNAILDLRAHDTALTGTLDVSPFD